MEDVDWTKVKNGEYKMPLHISARESYVHEEFRNVSGPNEAFSDKFDRLFDFFNFIKPDQSNINFMRVYQAERTSKTSIIKFSSMDMRKK